MALPKNKKQTMQEQAMLEQQKRLVRKRSLITVIINNPVNSELKDLLLAITRRPLNSDNPHTMAIAAGEHNLALYLLEEVVVPVEEKKDEG